MMNVSAEHSEYGGGIILFSSTETIMTNVSAAHNGKTGVYLSGSTKTSMTNVSAAHNRYDGLLSLEYSTDTSMTTVCAAHKYDECICSTKCGIWNIPALLY